MNNKKPIFICAHRCNKTQWVDDAVNKGFNAIETDIWKDNKEVYILPERIRSISKKRIKGYLSSVNDDIMKVISKLLHIILALEE
jgi:hypothetical protein